MALFSSISMTMKYQDVASGILMDHPLVVFVRRRSNDNAEEPGYSAKALLTSGRGEDRKVSRYRWEWRYSTKERYSRNIARNESIGARCNATAALVRKFSGTCFWATNGMRNEVNEWGIATGEENVVGRMMILIEKDLQGFVGLAPTGLSVILLFRGLNDAVSEQFNGFFSFFFFLVYVHLLTFRLFYCACE